MPQFIVPPQYVKITDTQTNTQIPCYTFAIQNLSDEDKIIFIANESADITLTRFQQELDNPTTWYKGFIEQFLQASKQYFTRQYTYERIYKIIKHTLQVSSHSYTNIPVFPTNVIVIPKHIQISGGVFTVAWEYDMESLIIEIPDLENNTNLPDSEQIEELNIDSLSIDDATDLDLQDNSRYIERQYVKEARLKAKLAIYKAERQMSQYYNKYGKEISDSELDSESDYTATDNED